MIHPIGAAYLTRWHRSGKRFTRDVEKFSMKSRGTTRMFIKDYEDRANTQTVIDTHTRQILLDTGLQAPLPD